MDTPGHAAFVGIRQRGAKATDIAVLVVAADEGVQEQTEETISYLLGDDIPMVVAMTKVDKRSANVDRCAQQLTLHGVFVETMGGDVPCVSVCAPTKEGLDDLLDTLLMRAEELNFRTDPTHMGEAIVLDCKHVQGRGAVTTAISRWGQFQQGDIVVVNDQVGKLRQVTINSSRLSVCE
jgi:translation initiation factor IF-2